jgi:RNA polymerase sigma factor (sigma-70 family)
MDNPRLWYAPDRRIRTKTAADKAKRIADWVKTGTGLDTEPDEQTLFAALHTCAFYGRRRPSGRQLPAKQRAAWSERWYVIRDHIVKTNFPLIYSMMADFHSVDLDRDELLSEAMFGLAQAAERFNPWRGFRFSTYACHAIRRSMIRSSKQASNYRRRFPVQHDVSFERPDDPGAAPDLYLERLQRAMDQNLGELTELESRILARRFPADNERRSTLQEIGEAVGLSKERVRQLQNSALNKLREVLESDPVLQ